MIDTEKLIAACTSKSEEVQAFAPDCTSDFDGGVAEGKVQAFRMMLDEIESGRLDAPGAWVQLCKQDLKLIRERGIHIRRRGGPGDEFTIIRMGEPSVPGATATLNHATLPALRTIVRLDELIAEFEEVH